MKNRKKDWPTYWDNMEKPYGRWPFAVKDELGKLWVRSKVKCWFEFVEYDNKSDGGYHSSSKHIRHKDLMFGEHIWDKKVLLNH